MNNTKIVWTDDELNFLKENFELKTNLELSIILNKTKKNIDKTLRRFNLFKSKNAIKELKSRRNKEVGRDLSYGEVLKIAKSFNSRGEFYQYDNVAYNKAVKQRWLDEICCHMVIKNISLPQLILKDILEYILNEKCSYNNRVVIKPLEIDCYFNKWKIGWEYDGRFFHKNDDGNIKRDICELKGVTLLTIHEQTKDFRKYEVNIKNQLINQIDLIEQKVGFKINVKNILNYKPIVTLPNMLTLYEKKIVYNKKMSEIKIIDIYLFNRIKKYKLYNDLNLNICNDLKTHNHFKSFDEYIIYLRSKNYPTFRKLCNNEHPHRLLRKWNIPITLISDLFNE